MTRSRLSILIPVRNEGKSLRVMLRLLQAARDLDPEILVFLDEPGDDRVSVTEEFQARNSRIRAVHNSLGPGVTHAVKAGVQESNGEILLLFAADDVGQIFVIDDMLRLLENGCDLVSGTRYAHGGRRYGGSRIGSLLSRMANTLIHLLGGMLLTDATTGLKIFRRTIFDRFQFEASGGWTVAFELSIKSHLAGLQMGEVPIVSIDRLFGGRSSFRLFPWVRKYLRWFVWALWQVRRSNRQVSPLMTLDHLPPGRNPAAATVPQ